MRMPPVAAPSPATCIETRESVKGLSGKGVFRVDRGLIIIAWIAGILIVLALGKALLLPLKVILKLMLNGVLGGIVIVVINLIGQYIGFTIPLNIVSALVAGILGLPGVILLVILKFLL